MTNPTNPSPVSLKVVAWRCTRSIPDDGKKLDATSTNPAYVAMHSGYNWRELTDRADAQAIIDRLTASLEALDSLTGDTIDQLRQERDEARNALKAAQPAASRPCVDELMALAEDYAQAVSTVDTSEHEVWRSDDFKQKRRSECDAAREALRAAMAATKAPCAGTNCATTTANHSLQCRAEHADAVAGKTKEMP